MDGSERIDQSFTFDGKVYPIGTQVDSEADVVFGGADYGFDLVHTEIIAIGLTLGVRAVSAKATIESPLLNQKGEGELQVALPASRAARSAMPGASSTLTAASSGSRSPCSPSGSATGTSTRRGRTTETRRKST